MRGTHTLTPSAFHAAHVALTKQRGVNDVGWSRSLGIYRMPPPVDAAGAPMLWTGQREAAEGEPTVATRRRVKPPRERGRPAPLPERNLNPWGPNGLFGGPRRPPGSSSAEREPAGSRESPGMTTWFDIRA